MPQHCTVVGCPASSSKSRGLSFFKLKRPDKEWTDKLVRTVNRADKNFNLNTAFICSRHFDKACFTIQGEGDGLFSRKALNDNCIPTLYMRERSFQRRGITPRKSRTNRYVQPVPTDTEPQLTNEAELMPSKMYIMDTSYSSDSGTRQLEKEVCTDSNPSKTPVSTDSIHVIKQEMFMDNSAELSNDSTPTIKQEPSEESIAEHSEINHAASMMGSMVQTKEGLETSSNFSNIFATCDFQLECDEDDCVDINSRYSENTGKVNKPPSGNECLYVLS